MSAVAKAAPEQISKVSKYAHRLTRESTLTTCQRELGHMWPFLVGFTVTGGIFLNIALGITDEEVKKSKFGNPNQKH